MVILLLVVQVQVQVQVQVLASVTVQDMKLSMSLYKYITASVKESTTFLRLKESDSLMPWLDRPQHKRNIQTNKGLLMIAYIACTLSYQVDSLPDNEKE